MSSVPSIKEEEERQIKTEQVFTSDCNLVNADTAVKEENEEKPCGIKCGIGETAFTLTSEQEGEPCDVKLEIDVAETPDQCWPGEAWLEHVEDFALCENCVSALTL